MLQDTSCKSPALLSGQPIMAKQIYDIIIISKNTSCQYNNKVMSIKLHHKTFMWNAPTHYITSNATINGFSGTTQARFLSSTKSSDLLLLCKYFRLGTRVRVQSTCALIGMCTLIGMCSLSESALIFITCNKIYSKILRGLFLDLLFVPLYWSVQNFNVLKFFIQFMID